MDIISERLSGRGKLRKLTAVFTIVAMLAGLAAIHLTSAPVGAQTVQETFELEGDPQDAAEAAAAPEAPEDWASLLSATANNNLVDVGNGVFRVAQTKVPIADPEETDDSYYKGGGSKDERDISGGGQTWLHSGTDVAPDKNSILNAAAVAYKVPDGPDGTTAAPETSPDLVLDFTLDRLANDGDAVVGFWFFKNRIGYSESNAQAFTGTHAVGDILVVSDFSGGGEVSTIRVYKWVGGSQKILLLGGTDTSTALIGGNQVDCAKPSPNPYVCGTANRGSNLDVAAAWPYTPKSGTNGLYPKGSFYEGGINVSAVVPDSDECFASFLAMTRSSTSTTAQLKDFVLGDLPICAPSTTLSASPTVAAPEVTVVGDTVTYSFVETNDGNIPLTNVYLTDDHASCNLSPSQANAVTLAAGASQTFTCSFASAAEGITEITAIGHGTSPLGVVTYCGTSTTTPPNQCAAGQIHDPQEKATAKSVAITPGTEMTITASPTTAVKQLDTVTLTITEKNDGTAPAGFESSLDLTSVAVSTDNTGCNNTLTRTTPTGTTDVILSAATATTAAEKWTYTCTIAAPADDFTVIATGVGTVLAGTTRARVVTYSAPTTATPPVETCVNASATTTAGVTTAGKFCDSEELVSATVVVISPSTRLDVTASAVITYTFKENNNSLDAPLTPPTPASRESVITTTESNVCNVTGLAYSEPGDVNNDGVKNAASGSLSAEIWTGDVDADKILDPLETWTFTCKGSLDGPTGTNVNSFNSTSVTGIGHGRDTSGTTDDVTYCGTATTPASSETGKVCDSDERDKVTVTITYQPRGANPAVI